MADLTEENERLSLDEATARSAAARQPQRSALLEQQIAHLLSLLASQGQQLALGSHQQQRLADGLLHLLRCGVQHLARAQRAEGLVAALQVANGDLSGRLSDKQATNAALRAQIRALQRTSDCNHLAYEEAQDREQRQREQNRGLKRKLGALLAERAAESSSSSSHNNYS